MAEYWNLPIMTICSTCQGVMSQANHRLKDPQYRAKINTYLADEGLEYQGNAQPKHLLWILIEDYGLDQLAALITPPPPRRPPRPLLRLLPDPPHRRPRIRQQPPTPRRPRAPDRNPRCHRNRLLRQNPLLRLPHPNHQRTKLPRNGRQTHRRSQRPRRRRHDHPLPPMPPQPRQLPTQSRRPSRPRHRPPHPPPTPSHRPSHGHQPPRTRPPPPHSKHPPPPNPANPRRRNPTTKQIILSLADHPELVEGSPWAWQIILSLSKDHPELGRSS